jgi:hypothetical protein
VLVEAIVSPNDPLELAAALELDPVQLIGSDDTKLLLLEVMGSTSPASLTESGVTTSWPEPA